MVHAQKMPKVTFFQINKQKKKKEKTTAQMQEANFTPNHNQNQFNKSPIKQIEFSSSSDFRLVNFVSCGKINKI